MRSSRHEQPNTSTVQDFSNTEELASLHIQDQRSGYASTYMVQEVSNKEELNRLAFQDQMLTTSMGGVLPELSDLTGLHRVLDAGCGTGGWLLEMARAIPTIAVLVGVDIRKATITYARTQAAADPVGRRVKYHVIDALDMSQLPPRFFDLVNQRLGMSYLRIWDWPRQFAEYQRVARSGGIIRITESCAPESNSEALNQLNDLLMRALSGAGHLFVTDSPSGVIDGLVPLFKQQGLSKVQTHLHTLEYRAGTPEGELFCKDEKRLFQVVRPFLSKWSHVPYNYKEIYRQALHDMQSPDFVATW